MLAFNSFEKYRLPPSVGRFFSADEGSCSCGKATCRSMSSKPQAPTYNARKNSGDVAGTPSTQENPFLEHKFFLGGVGGAIQTFRLAYQSTPFVLVVNKVQSQKARSGDCW
eukprot:GHVN01099587.1.p1 GENE.GHVN01099587.1~~GHVN01099587.1.p1  ORF type:complete len:111 (+),score=6.00 GHVN01099587.1:193-525(+)